MNNKLIMAGAALLLAASAVFIAGASQATQSDSRGGSFQLMHHSNPTANPGVFRVNSSTGEVSYCYVAGAATGENVRLNCLTAQ